MAGVSSKALNFGEPENKYKYNGIEKVNDLQIEIYDAQLREFDGQIGRWWEVDTKTEDMEMWSPYVSNYNNPIRYSDPLGDEGQECCETVSGPISWLMNVASDAAENASNRFNQAKQWVKSTIKQAGENASRRWEAGVDPLHQMVDQVKEYGPMSLISGFAPMSIVKGTLGTGIKSTTQSVAKGLEKYEVGTAEALAKKSIVGDGLDIHHVSQSKPASQIIQGYNKTKAPAIALSEAEHQAIPTLKGTSTAGNARQQLAKDIKDLRNHTNASNNDLQKLIDLNKKMYPFPFKKTN